MDLRSTLGRDPSAKSEAILEVKSEIPVLK
jgi:hypothetical protein